MNFFNLLVGYRKNKENLGVAIFAKRVPPILQITVDMFCCLLGARVWNCSVWVQQRLRASGEKVGVAVLGGLEHGGVEPYLNILRHADSAL